MRDLDLCWQMIMMVEEGKIIKMSTIPKQVKLKLLSPLAKVPEYQTKGSSGLDVCSIEDYVLQPGERKLIATGLSFSLPDNYEIQVRARSGLALKHGITVLNSPGTIDQDYTGPLGVILINNGDKEFKISVGDRIAQIVFAAVSKMKFKVVEELDVTTRGNGGFGSTGV